MKRTEKLEEMKKDFLWATKMKRLKSAEWDIITYFLELNETLDYQEFSMAVNRMFLSSSGIEQTKNAGTVQEILSCLARTTIGHYGYQGTHKWVHPLDREKYGGQEWIVEDAKERLTQEQIDALIAEQNKEDK